MPSLPLLEPGGQVLDFASTVARDVLQRAIEDVNDQDQSSLPLASTFVQHDDFSVRTERALGSTAGFNASAILAINQQRKVQELATATSTLSLGMAILALYWFAMMRRNFRRDLVMLLIVGDSWKSLWFLTFSLITFTRGYIKTESLFCQFSGYLLQVGFELCDFAVLFMSMHMYLQIFPPKHSMLGHDGLYRVRHWVYGIWFLVPNLTAGLAFMNPDYGYMAQGGFCSIPIRPFWYRLALFWIPRYLIWVYVVFVAVRIYRHVGSEFKVFGHEKASNSSISMHGESSIERSKERRNRSPDKQLSQPGFGEETSKHDAHDDESCAPDDVSSLAKVKRTRTLPTGANKPFASATERRQSTPNWPASINGFGIDHINVASTSKSNPASRRGSHQVSAGVFAEDFAPPAFTESHHRGSVTTLGSKRSSTIHSFEDIQALTPIVEGKNDHRDSVKSSVSVNNAMKLRRRAIQRQLRLLFIYPCLYLIFWIIPFVSNVMNYNDYYAQNPIFGLRMAQIFSVTIMTTADVLVFSWRERPWRHIPGSDGTFLGSLMWWRYCFDSKWAQGRRASMAPCVIRDVEAPIEKESTSGIKDTLKRLSVSRTRSTPRGSEASNATQRSPRGVMPHRRNYSGGSDRKHMEVDQAHERLAMEREEYELNRTSLQERRASIISQLQTTPGKKEWFDRPGDADLFRDDDPKVDEKNTTA